MEGIYFFGEHVRWNLGWNNPNQAGAFVAMLIPWLWGLGRLAGGGSWKANGLSMLWLAVELGLWFLLCKTYSRGALVAAGIAGVMFFLWNRYLSKKRSGAGWVAMRLLGIIILLLATGFFARIDPGYVSHDASAGNRLTLWKGGLQMIAASPWHGWGKGQSGSGFMHWFQPLDAKEAYAGMVNSYLHVGVEYGLPVLVMVLALALALVVISSALPWMAVVSRSRNPWGPPVLMAAGASIISFLISNFFSTLWIFKNLWWVPALSGVLVIGVGAFLLGRRFFRVGGITLSATTLVSVWIALVLFGVGKAIPGEVEIALDARGNVVAGRAGGVKNRRVLFFPDRSVLGENWGKEIRRLATAAEFQEMEISVCGTGFSGEAGGQERSPTLVVACGAQSQAGFAALSRFPDSQLILVHPLGKADVPGLKNGKVAVMLPLLDTRGTGRGWRVICQQRGWKCTTSPGVGQDVRLAWPDALVMAVIEM